MISIDERYRNDPVFHSLVEMIETLLRQGNTTPTELREALFLAQYKMEMRTPRRMACGSSMDAQVIAVLKDQVRAEME